MRVSRCTNLARYARSCGGCNDSEAIEPRRNAVPATSANRSDHSRYGLEKGVLRTGENDSMENSKSRLKNAAGPDVRPVPWNRISLVASDFSSRHFFTRRSIDDVLCTSFRFIRCRLEFFNSKRKRRDRVLAVRLRSEDRKDSSMIAKSEGCDSFQDHVEANICKYFLF